MGSHSVCHSDVNRINPIRDRREHPSVVLHYLVRICLLRQMFQQFGSLVCVKVLICNYMRDLSNNQPICKFCTSLLCP